MAYIDVSNAAQLPRRRRPFALLALMSIGMQIAFALWVSLLNNYVHDVAGFDGADLGWLQTIREIPGFFAIGVILVLYLVSEQRLAILALMLLAASVAVVAFFPSFTGLLITTFSLSIGFHYFEAVRQSLSLQWFEKSEAPKLLGMLLAANSFAALLVYFFIVVAWDVLGLGYMTLFLTGGGVSLLIALYCTFAFPQFTTKTPQAKKLILRREYWLYYALQFMAGARRQIFIVFASFMMVEKFGFEVHELVGLFLINHIANMVLAPLFGRVIARFGERFALILEYTGLFVIFATYAGIYIFDWGLLLASILYVMDHLFFALAIAQKTYLQKIARPEDMAPTAAVAFTINHIAAVFLPVTLGYVWVQMPILVFVLAAIFALISLGLSIAIPRHPTRGRETIFAQRKTGTT